MDLKKRYKEKQKKLDDYTFEHSLWKRFEGKDLDENQVSFLSQCMTENLEHARHVENERLTFNSIFLALVAGLCQFTPFSDCFWHIFLPDLSRLSLYCFDRKME